MNQERKIEVEEVSEAVKPPRARVGETFERKRDYADDPELSRRGIDARRGRAPRRRRAGGGRRRGRAGLGSALGPAEDVG